MQNHVRTGSFVLGLAAFVACPAMAEVETELSVDPGSSAVVQIRLEVDTFVGGDSGTDTDSTSVAGTALAELGPGNEAFTEMTINDLSLDLDSMNFSYDFFCVPIFGCSISADLNVSGFNLGVAEAISGTIQSNGNVVFNDALFNPSLSYDVDISGLISSSISGSISEVAAQTFSCTVDAANQSVSVSNFGIDQVIYDIDPAELPSGVDNVRIIATVDLTNVSMSGTYTEAMEGDLNGDGQVNGGDLGILLLEFGGPGSADFDGNGVVDGGDLGFLLLLWTK